MLEAITLGLHLLSLHTPSAGPDFETVTPGVYAKHENGLTVGVMRNSRARLGYYGGYSLERGNWAVTLGAIHGYDRAAWLPLVVPSYRFDNHWRVSLIPNPWGAKVLHVSYEF